MSYYKKRKPRKAVIKNDCCYICPPDENSNDDIRLYYCAGEILPRSASTSVVVCLKDDSEVTVGPGESVPQQINGFVLIDPVSKKPKYVPGKLPAVEPVELVTVLEMYCAGDRLPQNMISKVDICLLDGSDDCLGPLDMVPLNINGWISFDEVSLRSKYVPGKFPDRVRSDLEIINLIENNLPVDQVRTDEQIKQIVNVCIDLLPDDQVRTDAEIIAIVNGIVGQLPNTDTVRSDAEIKSIAQSCIDLLPDDQVRTDLEINVLAKAVVDQCFADLPADQVRSDSEIKAISEQCFNALSTQFLTASQIYAYIDEQPDNVRSDLEIQALAKVIAQSCIDNYNFEDTDTVRSDLEIEAISKQVFQACIALLPEDETRTDLEILALAKQTFNECITNFNFDGVDESEASVISKNTFLSCIAEYVRSDAELNAFIANYIELIPDVDAPRTDAEINALAKIVTQACIDDLPADQVRTDAEIKVIVEACIALIPADQVRTDAEINALAKTVAQSCIDLLPADQVRTDTEINTLIQEALNDFGSIRTDAELKVFVQDCFEANPVTPRTDAEIESISKVIAQACIDLLPADQVRTNAEIKAIAQDCIDLLPPDQVRTDAQIKAIAETCINANPNIDTFGIPQTAEQDGTDFFGKSYSFGDQVVVYPGNRVVCLVDKVYPQVVRVSRNPASDLSCVAECQYLFNCDNNRWLQKVDGGLVSVPATAAPSVGLFVGTIDARDFACKYEELGLVYCNNYQQSYEHQDICVNACVGSATTINFTIPIETGDGTEFTIDWGDGLVQTFADGSTPTHTYAEPYSGPWKISFESCSSPVFALASATGQFTYLDASCGCH